MGVIGTLFSFVSGQKIQSTQVNQNFLDIKTAFNTYAVLTDTAKTITAGHTFSGAQTFTGGIAASGAKVSVTLPTEPLRLGYSSTKYASFAVSSVGGLLLTPQASQPVSVTSFAASGPSTLTGQTRVGDLFRVEESPTSDSTGLQGAGIEMFVNPVDGCQLWSYNRTTLTGIPLTFQGGAMTFNPSVSFGGGITASAGTVTFSAATDVIVPAGTSSGIQWSGVARIRWDGIGSLETTNLAANAYVDFGCGNLYAHGSIKTGTPSLGTANVWKLGSQVFAGVTLNTTQYIQIDINGTQYKLATVT